MNSLTINMPKGLSQLSIEQLNQIKMSVAIDDLKSEYRAVIKGNAFNIEEKLSLWLADKAPDTQRMYSLYVNQFIAYLNDKSIISATTFDIDRFVMTILKTFSQNKSRLVFSAISSFYSSLVRWGDMSINPCKGARIYQKLGMHADIKTKHLPSFEDVAKLNSYFSKNTESAKKAKLAIYLMLNYGVRVGFLNKEHLVYDGECIKSFTKGKYHTINVKGDDYIKENKDILQTLNPHTISSTISRATKVLGIKLSVHDFRHVFATTEYTKDKDIYRVSRLLGHSSVTITERYLKGLEV